MSKFRSNTRTIVTEIKSFLIDTVSRTGMFRQAVSARIPDTLNFQGRDINVGPNNPFTVGDTEALLGILAPEPVLLEFRQSSIASADTQEDVPIFTKASIIISPNIRAGDPITFDVVDVDLPETVRHIEVLVFNRISGETEKVRANFESLGRYSGVLLTEVSANKGIDFDNTMNVASSNIIELRYNDTTVSTDEDPIVSASTYIVSPYVNVRVHTSTFIFQNRPVPVRVEYPEHTESTLEVQVINMVSTEIEHLVLNRVEDGVFIGTLQTASPSASYIQGDGILHVSPGDTIKIQLDPDIALATYATQAFLRVEAEHTIVGTCVAEHTCRVGSTFEITIEDYDLAGNGSLQIPVTNVTQGPFTLISLQEFIPFSGIFKATINIVDSHQTMDPLNIPAAVGDELSFVYMDIDPNTNIAASISHTATVLAAEPIPSIDDVVDDSEEVEYGRVTFYVDGLFYLNGKYKGELVVRGTVENSLTRCQLIQA